MFCLCFTVLMLGYFRAALYAINLFTFIHKEQWIYILCSGKYLCVYTAPGTGVLWWQVMDDICRGSRKGLCQGGERGAAPAGADDPSRKSPCCSSGALEKGREQEFEGAAFHLRATSGMAAMMLRSWEDATSSCAAQQKVPAQIPSCKVQKCISSRHGDVYNSLVTLQSSAASLGQSAGMAWLQHCSVCSVLESPFGFAVLLFFTSCHSFLVCLS